MITEGGDCARGKLGRFAHLAAFPDFCPLIVKRLLVWAKLSAGLRTDVALVSACRKDQRTIVSEL